MIECARLRLLYPCGTMVARLAGLSNSSANDSLEAKAHSSVVQEDKGV